MKTSNVSESASFDGALRTVTEGIIGCAFRVHSALGAGFVESIYEEALTIELERQDIRFVRQHPVRVLYEGKVVGTHRLDLLVEDSVIVELKAKEDFSNSDVASVLSYLKATGLSVALLLNFGTARLEIKRLGNAGQIKKPSC